MTRIRMRARAARLLLLAALLAPQWPNPAGAGACDGIPDCEPQVQERVPFARAETKYMDFYCVGDHPYAWGMWWYDGSGQTWDWTSDAGEKSCFAFQSEWAGPEDGHPSKYSLGAVNLWCAADAYRVTIACSKQMPPSAGVNGCIPDGGIVADPGCPTTWEHNNCQNTGIPVCFQNVIETCSDGTKYACTAELGFVWCQHCAR